MFLWVYNWQLFQPLLLCMTATKPLKMLSHVLFVKASLTQLGLGKLKILLFENDQC